MAMPGQARGGMSAARRGMLALAALLVCLASLPLVHCATPHVLKQDTLQGEELGHKGLTQEEALNIATELGFSLEAILSLTSTQSDAKELENVQDRLIKAEREHSALQEELAAQITRSVVAGSDSPQCDDSPNYLKLKQDLTELQKQTKDLEMENSQLRLQAGEA